MTTTMTTTMIMMMTVIIEVSKGFTLVWVRERPRGRARCDWLQRGLRFTEIIKSPHVSPRYPTLSHVVTT